MASLSQEYSVVIRAYKLDRICRQWSYIENILCNGVEFQFVKHPNDRNTIRSKAIIAENRLA